MPKLKKQPTLKFMKRYSIVRSITLWQRIDLVAENKRQAEKICRQPWVDWQTIDESESDPVITVVKEEQ